MARRKKNDHGAAGCGILILLALMAIAMATVVLLPVAWLVAEIVRFTKPKPKGGFDFTEDELRLEKQGRAAMEQCEEAIEQLEDEAAKHGCVRRNDGLFNERRKIAKIINPKLEELIETRDAGEASYELLLEQPMERYGTWAKVQAWVWALRFCLLSWVITYFVRPDLYDRIIYTIRSAEGLSSYLLLGFSAGMLVGLGAVAGFVGYGVGMWIASMSKPRSGRDAIASRR